MSRSGHSPHKPLQKTEPFEERVDLLFEELAFAVENDRPSILLAPFASEYIRREVEQALEERLKGIGQALLHFTVEEDQFDIPLLLSRHAARQNSVYSVAGLAWGGGRESANAYRALNIRRELLVDHLIRVIVWATAAETVDLSRHAPDFWAFRHRVIEFDRPADLERVLPAKGGSPGTSISKTLRTLQKASPVSQEDPFIWIERGQTCLGLHRPGAGLYAFRKALKVSPENVEALLGLAQSQRMLGRNQAALKTCQQAQEQAPLDVQAWLEVGDLHLDLGLLEEARQAYQKAIKCDADNPRGWAGLGRASQAGGHIADAIINYQRALELDPANIPARLSVIACHKQLDEQLLAEEEIKHIRPYMENARPYDQAILTGLCGETITAVELLRMALEKRQVGQVTLVRDPNLDILRPEPAFQDLLRSITAGN